MSSIEGKVLKHNEQTRTMHWIIILSFIALALTGIGLYFKIGFLNNIFGGPDSASLVHRWAGVVFTIVPALYILFNFERFSRFMDTITTFTRDDLQWFKTMGGYVPFLKGDVPPQDKYNAGQKMLGLLIVIGALFVILTGFPMWLWRHDVSPAFLNICYNVHLWTAIIFILAICGHFFLAAINPKSRVEFGSMILDGYVDAQDAAHHNEKWFKQLREEKSSIGS